MAEIEPFSYVATTAAKERDLLRLKLNELIEAFNGFEAGFVTTGSETQDIGGYKTFLNTLQIKMAAPNITLKSTQSRDISTGVLGQINFSDSGNYAIGHYHIGKETVEGVRTLVGELNARNGSNITNLRLIAGSTPYITASYRDFTAAADNDVLVKKHLEKAIGNGTVTIKQGNVTKGTFTLNGSSDVTIDLDEGGGGASVWGQITGNLADQTDLKNALDAITDNIASLNTDVNLINGDIADLQGNRILLPPETTTSTDATTRATVINWNPPLPLPMSDVIGKLPKLKFISNGHITEQGLTLAVDEVSTYDSDPTDGIDLHRTITLGTDRLIERVQLNSRRMSLRYTSIPDGAVEMVTLTSGGLAIQDGLAAYVYTLLPTIGDTKQILTPEFIEAGDGVILEPRTAGPGLKISAFGGAGSATWGQITGTLSNQTDLKNALDAIGLRIDDVEDDLQDEVETLTSAINAEAATRMADDQTIRGFITDLQTAITNETNARSSEDAALGLLINNLRSDLTSETRNRENEDNRIFDELNYMSDAITNLESDKADRSEIKNSTITITQGGVTKGSFTLNQASGATIALDAGGSGSRIVEQITGVSISNVINLINLLTGYTQVNDIGTQINIGSITIEKDGTYDVIFQGVTFEYIGNFNDPSVYVFKATGVITEMVGMSRDFGVIGCAEVDTGDQKLNLYVSTLTGTGIKKYQFDYYDDVIINQTITRIKYRS